MAIEKKAESESAHDILRGRNRSLGMFFSPALVAVIGASEAPGSVGRAILSNLISHPFGGVVYPVNPKRTSVLVWCLLSALAYKYCLMHTVRHAS